MRYAVYFTPPADDPLTRTAIQWLGRDAFGGKVLAPHAAGDLSAAECAFHTAAARRYGFHATLKAPFRLAEGETEASLFAQFDAFAAAVQPVEIPSLALKRLDGFFALVPDARWEPLHRLADDVVVAFERFRAPLSDAEIERRNPDALRPREFRNLHQWGYPYVFEAFRFHMTLSGRVAPPEVARVDDAIRQTFSAFIGRPLPVATLALFVEPEPGAPFSVRRIAALGAPQERKSA